ncbi:MAG: hypothetical protein KatS3mg034_0794 [Vicingaceae bacterium]|jgi:hypothetical protein|nr:MAG: hypothetical protein KatS3mg034_0794 [Vicingaceae bacterium]
METLLLTILLLVFAVAGIAVKIIFKKNGEFSGTCAGNNPLLKEQGVSCSICGAQPDEACKKEESQ